MLPLFNYDNMHCYRNGECLKPKILYYEPIPDNHAEWITYHNRHEGN